MLWPGEKSGAFNAPPPSNSRVKINPSKTEFILLRSRRQNVDMDLSINFGDDVISPSHSVKVLGVVIDSYLSWEDHVSSIVRRCYCVLVGLARARQKLPKCTKRLLVEALVFPHLQYCITVWANCNSSQKKAHPKSHKLWCSHCCWSQPSRSCHAFTSRTGVVQC